MNRTDNGFVLVSVLWVVALLTVIALSYNYRARLEVQAARYSLDSSQARMAARAGVERGLFTLKNRAVVESLTVPVDAPPTPPHTSLGQDWAQSLNLYRADGELDPGPDFAEDTVRVSIEDLDRFINLNQASDELIANLPGVSMPLARRINYRRLGVPDEGIPVQPFQHPDELRYLDAIDDEAWYGEDETPGLRDVLTTYGNNQVNINTAPLAVLDSLPEVDTAVAEDIIALRNGVDGLPDTTDDIGFYDWPQFSEATGIRGDTLVSLQQYCKFNSGFFRITSLATRRGGKIQSQCVVVVEVPVGSDIATMLSWSEESLGAP